MAVHLPPPDPSQLHPVDGIRLGVTAAGIKKPGRLDLLVMQLDAGASVAGEPAEVRLRVCARCETQEQARAVTREVEALYLNGPAGGGGATQSVREVIAADAVLIPRDWVRARVEVLS